MMKVFLASGFFKNVKRSIIDGVKIDELDIRDPSLKKRILEYYHGVVKLWALKESLHPQWISIDEGDYILFYHDGSFIYACKVHFKYPFEDKPEQVEVGSHLAESVWVEMLMVRHGHISFS